MTVFNMTLVVWLSIQAFSGNLNFGNEGFEQFFEQLRSSSRSQEYVEIGKILSASPYKDYFSGDEFLPKGLCPAFDEAKRPKARLRIAERVVGAVLLAQYDYEKTQPVLSGAADQWNSVGTYFLSPNRSDLAPGGANCNFKVRNQGDERRCFVSLLLASVKVDGGKSKAITEITDRDALSLGALVVEGNRDEFVQRIKSLTACEAEPKVNKRHFRRRPKVQEEAG